MIGQKKAIGRSTLYLAAITALTCMVTSDAAADHWRKPPPAVAFRYQTRPDRSISSEFTNSSEIGTKFTYRRTNGAMADSSNTRYRNGRLQVLGIKGSNNGGGLTHMRQSQYGFYTVHFKLTGLKLGKSSAWHPSIWSTHTNQGARPFGRNLADKSRTIDINWMEVWNFPTWNGSLIDKKDGRRVALYAHDIGNTYGFGQWNTWGLEYHPNYIATWERRNGTWRRIRTAHFSNNDVTTEDRISKATRSPMFWQFSNKYHYEPGSDDTVNLYLEHFLYYPLK